MTRTYLHTGWVMSAAVAGLMVSAQAYAGPTGAGSAAAAGRPLSANITALRLGYEATHFDRAEKGPSGGTVDSDKGWLNGVNLSWIHVGRYLYLSSGLNYGGGSVNYNGGVQYIQGNGAIGSVPYQGNIDEKLGTAHFDIGPTFHLMAGRDAIAPFVGVGARVHYDHTSRTHVNVSGVGNLAVPSTKALRVQGQARFGLMDRFQVTRKLGVELKMLGTYNAWGRLYNKRYNGTTNHAGNYKGHDLGYIGSVTADYQLTHHLGVYGRASYTRANTSRIDLSSNTYEPKATNKDTRLVVGLQAHF